MRNRIPHSAQRVVSHNRYLLSPQADGRGESWVVRKKPVGKDSVTANGEGKDNVAASLEYLAAQRAKS